MMEFLLLGNESQKYLGTYTQCRIFEEFKNLNFFQVAVEATLEHPFFVVGHGWSSSSPDHTLAKYRLPCKQLRVGDVCISLTHCETTTTTTNNTNSAMTSTTIAANTSMMKPPPPPAELLEQRRRSNSASPSDKILKRSYNHSSRNTTSTSSSSPCKQVVFADPPTVG